MFCYLDKTIDEDDLINVLLKNTDIIEYPCRLDWVIQSLHKVLEGRISKDRLQTDFLKSFGKLIPKKYCVRQRYKEAEVFEEFKKLHPTKNKNSKEHIEFINQQSNVYYTSISKKMYKHYLFYYAMCFYFNKASNLNKFIKENDHLSDTFILKS